MEQNYILKKRVEMVKYKHIKNILDKLIAIILLIVTLPISIVIAFLIKLDSKGKVIFKHKRVGKDKKIIYVYKFRTMVENAEKLKEKFTAKQKQEFENKYKLENDPRITNIGKKIRKLSLDEIPQLINVLKGEMAIVGPRPITYEETKKYGKNKQQLLSVKPGIVGAWTANGRNNVEYSKRIELELNYTENITLKNDIKIILKTLIAVIQREGAM